MLSLPSSSLGNTGLPGLGGPEGSQLPGAVSCGETTVTMLQAGEGRAEAHPWGDQRAESLSVTAGGRDAATLPHHSFHPHFPSQTMADQNLFSIPVILLVGGVMYVNGTTHSVITGDLMVSFQCISLQFIQFIVCINIFPFYGCVVFWGRMYILPEQVIL